MKASGFRKGIEGVSDLVVGSNRAGRSVVKVTPESAGWEYVGFEVLRLEGGQILERDAGNEEVCLVVKLLGIT